MAGACLEYRLRDLVGGGKHPARQRLLGQLTLGEALGDDEAGEHEADVHAVLSLLEVQRVAPAAERELAGGVGARVPARDAARGARDVRDRARRRAAQERQ